MKMTRNNVAAFAIKNGYSLAGVSGTYTLIHPDGTNTYHRKLEDVFDKINEPAVVKATAAGKAADAKEEAEAQRLEALDRVPRIDFNTGRLYTKDGQRIVAAFYEGKILFWDCARGVYGELLGDRTKADLNQASLMSAYDNGAYQYPACGYGPLKEILFHVPKPAPARAKWNQVYSEAKAKSAPEAPPASAPSPEPKTAEPVRRVWSNEYVLESRTEYGVAARGNRSQHSGQKIHRLQTEYIVGIVEGVEPRPGTLGAEFKRTGKPVLFSCRPACGCCQGQHAGRPFPKLGPADVTCSKC